MLTFYIACKKIRYNQSGHDENSKLIHIYLFGILMLLLLRRCCSPSWIISVEWRKIDSKRRVVVFDRSFVRSTMMTLVDAVNEHTQKTTKKTTTKLYRKKIKYDTFRGQCFFFFFFYWFVFMFLYRFPAIVKFHNALRSRMGERVLFGLWLHSIWNFYCLEFRSIGVCSALL